MRIPGAGAPIFFHRGGCRRGSLSRAMQLLCWWQVLLWVLGLPAHGLEEDSGHPWREERPVPALQVGAVYLHEEEVAQDQDLMDFLNPNGSDCTLVLFYTPWCRFSASLAPHFNSLPRAFPTLGFLALDASQHSSLSTRFGTVAVPNILLFQGAKPMARFNHTDRTLETLKIFIFNQTGIEAKKNVVVTQADQMGPLPSTLIKTVDWLLVFSLFFLISFIMYATIRTESIRWLIPGQEQEHAE